MNKETAAWILRIALECSGKACESVPLVKANCTRVEFLAYRSLAARVIGYIFLNVLAPIYDEHPDLAPSWYVERKAPPAPLNPDAGVDLGATGVAIIELRDQLLALMDEINSKMTTIRTIVQATCDSNEAERCAKNVDEVLKHIKNVRVMLHAIGQG